MFSALRQGSLFYILEKKDKPVLKIGAVETVSAPRYSTTSPFNMVVDIVVRVGQEKLDFKGVPSATSIADFGAEGVIISESKEAMITEVDNMLQSSKQILNNIDYHRSVVDSYTDIMKQLNPAVAKEQQRDQAIDDLSKRVDVIQGGLDKIITILTSADKKIINDGITVRTDGQWFPEQEAGEAPVQVD